MLTPEALAKLIQLYAGGTEVYNDAIGLVDDNFYVPGTIDDFVQMYNGFVRLLAGERAGCDDHPYLVVIDAEKYPGAAKHIDDSVDAGQPRTLTLDRPRANERRKENMRASGLPPIPRFDRDEYPPAAFEESTHAGVRYVSVHDNRGAAAQMRNQLTYPAKVPDGAKVMFYTTNSFPVPLKFLSP